MRTRGKLRTTVDEAKKQAQRAKREREPTMAADDFVGKRDAISQAVAADQIKALNRLIKLTDKTHKEYPDLFLRKADLYLGLKAFYERQAGALYQRIHDHREAGRKSAAADALAKQKRLQREARRASQAAIKAYEVIVSGRRFLSYKKYVDALYFYAFELGQLGREADMQAAYVRLLQEFPSSKYVPQVYLAFGDHKFAKGDIQSALTLFEKIVTGYPGSPVYAYALYKIAWCHLNPVGTAAARYDLSLQRFTDTIKATLAGKAGSKANAKQLRRDARRDLVLAFVHAGRPSKAWAFFERVGSGPTKAESMQRKMMTLLAGAYFGEGKYIESSSVYKRLQDLFPHASEGCHWQKQVVVNALATDDNDIQWNETERLAQYWRAFAGSKHAKQAQRRCRSDAKGTLTHMATVWHNEADKTRRANTYDLAEKAYRAYLDLFAKAKGSYDIHMYYAELLWQQAQRLYESKDRAAQKLGVAKFGQAHAAFVKVLEMDPKGKWAEEAARAQMLAMRNHHEYDETGGKANVCRVQTDGTCVYRERRRRAPTDKPVDAATRFPVTPLSDAESAMLGAYDLYAKNVTKGKSKELPKILYHRAKLMVEHNMFDKARPMLETLVSNYDGTIYAAWSAEMLLDVLTIGWKDTANDLDQELRAGAVLTKWAKRLEKKKLFAHKEADRVRERAPVLMMGVAFREAEIEHERAKAGEADAYARCGYKYLEIYVDYESHDRAGDLLFNAARCFEAGHLMGRAINSRKELLAQFRSHPKRKQTLKELAENYQAIAWYGHAADNFERFAGAYKKDPYAAEALQNAFLFRVGLGEDDKADLDLQRYEDMFRRKDVKKAAGIYWARHDLVGDADARLAHARQYIRNYGGKGGLDRLVVAHATAGQILWRRSCKGKLLHDACVTIKRRKKRSKETEIAIVLRNKGKRKVRCGPDTRALITVHARDAKLAAAAQRHFADIAKLARRTIEVPKDDARRVDDFRNARGMAMVYRADHKYEEYLRVDMPTKLDFGTEHVWKKDTALHREYVAAMKRRAETMSRVGEYLRKKDGLALELERAYGGVTASGSPHWVLAAAARSAMLYQEYADQLLRAEVPRAIKTEEMYNAYCDELADAASRPERKATAAFEYCLDKSTKFQYFNEFSRLCETEMQQRQPDAYPATNELLGRSQYTESRLDVVPVQTKLDVNAAAPEPAKAPGAESGL